MTDSIWDDAWDDEGESYITGTGQHLKRVHAENDDCKFLGCVIHRPTDPHPEFPTHWRGDRGLMERICPHGVGHPDADHMAYVRRTFGDATADTEGVHGCDGCCRPESDTIHVDIAEEILPPREEFMFRVYEEMDRMYRKHGREQWSRHEFYGILLEEIEEVWADIKSDAPMGPLEAEMVQVVAVCLRYFETRDRHREPDYNG